LHKSQEISQKELPVPNLEDEILHLQPLDKMGLIVLGKIMGIEKYISQKNSRR
jgi:hypothetical protein